MGIFKKNYMIQKHGKIMSWDNVNHGLMEGYKVEQ